MSVSLSPLAGAAAQFLDNSGNVLTGGKLYTYLAGTTTPAVTYTSISGVVAHTNPIVLDASGRVPGGEIWLLNNISYKFLLKDSNDVLIGTYDNIFNSISAENVIYNEGGAGAIDRTVKNKLQESISVKDFGAVGDGITDDTAAITAAFNSAMDMNLNQAGAVYIPAGQYLCNSQISVTIPDGGSSTANLYNGLIIHGDGPQATKLIASASNSNGIFKITMQNEKQRVQITELQFVSKLNATTNTGQNNGIALWITSNQFSTTDPLGSAQFNPVYLNNVWVASDDFSIANAQTRYGVWNKGIKIDYQRNIKLLNVRLRCPTTRTFSAFNYAGNCDTGIEMTNCYDPVIQNSNCAGFWQRGIAYTKDASLPSNQERPEGGFITQCEVGGAVDGIVLDMNYAPYDIPVTSVNSSGVFTFTSLPITSLGPYVGQPIVITGTNTGTGSISGYVSGTTYYIIAQTGTSSGGTFTLSATYNGSAITTTSGTLSGLTFLLTANLYIYPDVFKISNCDLNCNRYSIYSNYFQKLQLVGMSAVAPDSAYAGSTGYPNSATNLPACVCLNNTVDVVISGCNFGGTGGGYYVSDTNAACVIKCIGTTSAINISGTTFYSSGFSIYADTIVPFNPTADQYTIRVNGEWIGMRNASSPLVDQYPVYDPNNVVSLFTQNNVAGASSFDITSYSSDDAKITPIVSSYRPRNDYATTITNSVLGGFSIDTLKKDGTRFSPVRMAAANYDNTPGAEQVRLNFGVWTSGANFTYMSIDGVNDRVNVFKRLINSEPLILASYTVATLPSASTYVRGIIYVSDGTSNKRLAVSDGTNWRWPDGVIVS